MMFFADGGSKTPAANHLSLSEKALVLLTGVRLSHIGDSVTPESRHMTYAVVRIPTRDSFLEAWTITAQASRGNILMFHGYGASKSSLPLHP